MHRFAIGLMLLSGLALAGCRTEPGRGKVLLTPPATPEAGEQAPNRAGPRAPAKGQPLDDQALYAYLEQQGLRLLKAGRLATNLAAQCSRRRCALELPAPGRQTLSAVQVAAAAEDSVMVIGYFYRCARCGKTHCGSASGFVISSSGALATSLHVLSQTNFLGMVAMSRDGRVYPVCEVLAASRPNDSVILQLEGDGLTPLPLATVAPVGSRVEVLSHPAGHYYTFTTGVVSRHLSKQQRRNTVAYLAITAAFGAGSSGAPVMNEQGAAVAMVNNTEAVFGEASAEQKQFQMSVFNCTTTQALLDMVETKN